MTESPAATAAQFHLTEVNLPVLRESQTARAAVSHLQHMFNDFGEQPRFDEIGKFGPKTLAAVKKFQQDNHLAVDGVVGRNTWKALLERWLPG
jgi:peptidoglycan hydrolase-like protein with peptidoglycan-binding domain